MPSGTDLVIPVVEGWAIGYGTVNFDLSQPMLQVNPQDPKDRPWGAGLADVEVENLDQQNHTVTLRVILWLSDYNADDPWWGLVRYHVLFLGALPGREEAPPPRCRPDSVLVGTTCVDKYEASVWQIPTRSSGLLERIQNGTVTVEYLARAGATQISPGTTCTPPFPSTFPTNGNWTQPLYAVSIPGVIPTSCKTSWFQAAQACALSGKRLLTNQEWQLAAAGTPDVADDGVASCVTQSPAIQATGSRPYCKSRWGAFDMAGNVWEWVADWVPQSTAAPGWGAFSDDRMALAGAATTAGPAALVRGGGFVGGVGAGAFAVSSEFGPHFAIQGTDEPGFRCGR